jgi:hypothetical protein
VRLRLVTPFAGLLADENPDLLGPDRGRVATALRDHEHSSAR